MTVHVLRLLARGARRLSWFLYDTAYRTEAHEARYGWGGTAWRP